MKRLNGRRKMLWVLTVLLALSPVVELAFTSRASAVEMSINDFYSQNDINYYSETACAVNSGDMTLSPAAATAESSKYEEAVFRFLISNNFTKNANKPMNGIQAAGALGNFFQESGVNPKSIQRGKSYNETKARSADGGYGFGLAQWDMERRQNLLAFADQQGKAWNDIDLQLAFMKHELDETIWGDYVFKDSDFRAAATPKDAAYRFMKDYEKAGKPNQAARDNAAERYYKQYGSLAPSAPIDNATGSACGSGSLPANGDIANTAIEMAKWNDNYIPGGGHGSLDDLKSRIAAKFQGNKGVDCSGFTRAVIYVATGTDPGAIASGNDGSRGGTGDGGLAGANIDQYFKKITVAV